MKINILPKRDKNITLSLFLSRVYMFWVVQNAEQDNCIELFLTLGLDYEDEEREKS